MRAHYRGVPPDAVNSLLAGRLAGRRMETDARKGEKHGIATPLNRMAVTLLEAVGVKARADFVLRTLGQSHASP